MYNDNSMYIYFRGKAFEVKNRNKILEMENSVHFPFIHCVNGFPNEHN